MDAIPARRMPALLLLGLTGCATLGGSAPTADVALVARSGGAVAGALVLSESQGGVRLRGEVRGLKPGAEHGFHIHDKGDCSAPDATSAGGHFNPGGTAHGRHGAGVHHAGDLPSLVADAGGVAKIDAVIKGITLAAGPTSVVGRSLIVHRDPDDFVTQPTGNSGPRIGCGVVVLR
jgi:Cu-Zn family superoxide dismutase